MKITVVTVVFNSASTIRDCIESVCSQSHPDIEHIIIDGGSTDGTLDILATYPHLCIVSEPDHGIYDAMNKGIRMATGDVIAILNSDDFYVDPEVLSRVASTFSKHPTSQCVYGDLQYVDQFNTSIVRRVWTSRPYATGLFRTGWHPAHPSFFVRKSVYDSYGLYTLELPIASDYEFMLRTLERFGVQSTYIPSTLVSMRTGGVSNRSFRSLIQGNRESLLAWTLNGLRPPLFLFFRKPLSKIIQVLCALWLRIRGIFL